MTKGELLTPRQQVYACGDLASVRDPRTGRALPPLAQVALEEAETVARNLDAELDGKPLERFCFTTRAWWSRSATTAASPSSAASPAADGSPTCSKTPSRGSTANPSSICTAGTPLPSDRTRRAASTKGR